MLLVRRLTTSSRQSILMGMEQLFDRFWSGLLVPIALARSQATPQRGRWVVSGWPGSDSSFWKARTTYRRLNTR